MKAGDLFIPEEVSKEDPSVEDTSSRDGSAGDTSSEDKSQGDKPTESKVNGDGESKNGAGSPDGKKKIDQIPAYLRRLDLLAYLCDNADGETTSICWEPREGKFLYASNLPDESKTARDIFNFFSDIVGIVSEKRDLGDLLEKTREAKEKFISKYKDKKAYRKNVVGKFNHNFDRIIFSIIAGKYTGEEIEYYTKNFPLKERIDNFIKSLEEEKDQHIKKKAESNEKEIGSEPSTENGESFLQQVMKDKSLSFLFKKKQGNYDYNYNYVLAALRGASIKSRLDYLKEVLNKKRAFPEEMINAFYNKNYEHIPLTHAKKIGEQILDKEIIDQSSNEKSVTQVLSEESLVEAKKAGEKLDNVGVKNAVTYSSGERAVHSEMKIAQYLMENELIKKGDNTKTYYISTSKQCCRNCENVIKAINTVCNKAPGAESFILEPVHEGAINTRDLLIAGTGHQEKFPSAIPPFLQDDKNPLYVEIKNKLLEISNAKTLEEIFFTKDISSKLNLQRIPSSSSITHPEHEMAKRYLPL